MRLLAMLTMFVALTGCRYERSFLNINSDSGVPFLGLQLSVDAGAAQQPSSRPDSQVALSVENTTPMLTHTSRAQSPAGPFVPAAEFPDANSDSSWNDPVKSPDPFEEIGRRLAAF